MGLASLLLDTYGMCYFETLNSATFNNLTSDLNQDALKYFDVPKFRHLDEGNF